MPHPTNRADRRAETTARAFVPTWARGRETLYHARERASYTLRDDVMADVRLTDAYGATRTARDLAESDR